MAKIGKSGGGPAPKPGGGSKPSASKPAGSPGKPANASHAKGQASGAGAKTTSLAPAQGPGNRSRTAPLNADDLRLLKGSGVSATIGLEAISQPGAGKASAPRGQAIQPKTVLAQAFADDPTFKADLKAMKGQWDDKAKGGEKLGRVLVNLLDKPSLLPGMATGKDLVKSIVADLAHPMRISQGQGTTTCTTASLQIILARSKPAEYARIAGGIATQGEVDLRGGGKLKQSPRDLENLAGREPLHAAMQESMYRLGQTLGKDDKRETDFGGRFLKSAGGSFAGRLFSAAARSFAGTFRTAVKTAFAGTSFTSTRRSFAGDGSAGLNIQQFNALNRMVTGSDKVAMQPSTAVLQQLRTSGDDVTVFLRPQKGAESGHAVVITSWDGDRAVIDDPEKSEKVKMSTSDLLKHADFVQSQASSASESQTTLEAVRPNGMYWPSSLSS